MTARVELTVYGSLDHLRLAWQVGESVLEQVPFEDDPEATRYNVLVSIQEMITNVLRHAYGGQPGPVHLTFTSDDREIRIELRDNGPEFDPVAHDTTPLVAGTDETMPEAPGGYGILIVRTVMDGMQFRRDGDWNVLTMTKRVAQTANV